MILSEVGGGLTGNGRQLQGSVHDDGDGVRWEWMYWRIEGPHSR